MNWLEPVAQKNRRAGRGSQKVTTTFAELDAACLWFEGQLRLLDPVMRCSRTEDHQQHHEQRVAAGHQLLQLPAQLAAKVDGGEEPGEDLHSGRQ